MQAQEPPTTLPGKTLHETIVASEMLNTVHGAKTIDFCWGKCITHFGEDALPYHTGEKSCFDRCASKIRFGFDLSKSLVKEFNAKMADDHTEFAWMKVLGTSGPAPAVAKKK